MKMLVELFPVHNWKRNFHNHDVGPRSVSAKKALPFFASKRMTRIHRTRAVTFHHEWIDKKKGLYRIRHTSHHAWCGVTGFDNKGSVLMKDPVPSWPVCAICEGKAVGAGQIDSESLTDHELIFTPRKAA